MSPWVTLVTRNVRLPGLSGIHQFHSFRQADYVTMFAVTRDGKIPLVRQYRPALERFTLELPSGLLDNPAEQPAQAAARELFEETGFIAGDQVKALGCLSPDSARLENRLWAYFASDARLDKSAVWKPDPQLECLLVNREEFRILVEEGRFEHALHLAVIGLALLRGMFSFN